MTRQWKLKLMAYLIGLGLVVFGLAELRADESLRTLKPIAIGALEDGSQLLQDGEYIQVTGAWLLRPGMVHTDPDDGEVHAFAGMASRGQGRAGRSRDDEHPGAELRASAMPSDAAASLPAAPSLWVRLDGAHPSEAAASAALGADALYAKPFPVTGIVHALPEALRVQALQGGAQIGGQPWAVHAGTSPALLDAGLAVAVAGATLWLVIGVWVWADFSAERWRRRLAGSLEGAEVFQGRSVSVLWALACGSAVLLATGAWVEAAANRQVFNLPAATVVLLGLPGFGLALRRSRALVALYPDAVARIDHRGVASRWPLADVVALGVDEQQTRRRMVSCRYTLHAAPELGRKPLHLGSNLLHGGLDDPQAFGVGLRTRVVERLSPRLAESLRAGEHVAFGPLLAGREGLSRNRKGVPAGELLPWAEVDSAKVDRLGNLRIKRKGKRFAWGVYPARKILNRDVLIRFMERGGP